MNSHLRRQIGLRSLIVLSLVALSVCSAGAQTEQAQFARLDSYKIHYLSYGKGSEALVFVHGGVGSLNNWKLQTPAFVDQKRLILVDLPGHGHSDKPRVAYSMDLFARAIDAVLRDAKVDKAVLVGISMGTPVIRQFYRRYPEKVAALVFVDGPLRPLAPTQEIGVEFIAPFRRPDYMEAAKKFNAGLMTGKIPAEMREQIISNWASTPQHVIVSVLEQVILPQTDPEIWKEDPIKVPVLGIYTKNDYVPADNEQHLRRLAHNTEYHGWSDVGHGIPMEMPQQFNKTLRAFLVKIGWDIKPTSSPGTELQSQKEKSDELLVAVDQLRYVTGNWSVTTEFLNKDGSLANSVQGSYRFAWVVPDRVLSGESELGDPKQRSAILFYVNEKKKTIEMVSVGEDGRLWTMTGAAGDEVRTSQPFKTAAGKEAQLRFTRYNVKPDSFESKMEYTEDGGKTWLPGNHQVFKRKREP